MLKRQIGKKTKDVKMFAFLSDDDESFVIKLTRHINKCTNGVHA
jgi:hypothetical protein